MRAAIIGFLLMLSFAAGSSTAARLLVLSDAGGAAARTAQGAPPSAPVETPEPLDEVQGASLVAPARSEAAADFPAREVTIGEPVPFPPDTIMFIESGCFACDGPPSRLWRVSRAGEGAVSIEKAFELDRSLYPRGFLMRYDFAGQAITATVCDMGNCSWLGAGDADATISLIRSKDLGFNWTQTASFKVGAAFPIGITEEGMVVGEWDGDVASFRYLESGGPAVMPGAPDRLFGFVSNGRLLWQAQDGTILDDAGRRIDTPEPGARVNGVLFEGSELRLIAWYEREERPGVVPDWYVTTYLGGGEETFELPSYAYTAEFLDGRFLALSLELRGDNFRPTASLLDTFTATVHPISELADARFGRNFVRAVVRGPFIRATAAEGSCLAVHSTARRQSGMVVCLPDGALLTSLGQTRRFRGEDWQTVALPDGRTGWAPSLQLQR